MKNAKIMIVEDEVLTAMSLKEELNSMGYEGCKFVTTGVAAIENVEKARPDIVLMDIMLKSENGIETANEIHSRHNIPIIFLTSCKDDYIKEMAEEVDHAGYFIKPVDLEELRLAIEKGIQEHKSTLK